MLNDPYKRNPLRKRATDAILGNMELASPPSRKDIGFLMSRALEYAPAIEILQWRSADSSTYQLQVCYQGDSPTWLLRRTDEDPPLTIWRLVTEDPEQVYRLLLKKSTPNAPLVTQTGSHATFTSTGQQHQAYVDNGGLQPVVDGTIFLDRYKILGPIAQGGMGIVYKGIDLVLERDVAVKVLHAHLVDKDSVRQRFEKEMQACINFKHPNVVSVFDYGYSPQKLPYMVMEYCPGKTLDEYLNAVETLDIETFIKVFTQVSQALAYAHDKMVIHRDVKPKNIVLVEQGDELLAKLLDFGIAKGFAEANTLQKLTQTGDAIGSPYYMSPEQCKSAPLDVRSDVYSIGCVMYQAISGRVPFNGENGLTTILMHINDRCPPFSMLQADLRIPNALEQIILKCLEKNPNDRYQTARTLSDALQEFVEYFRKGERPNLEEHQRGVAENTTRQDSGVYAEGSRLNEPPSFAAQQILSLLTIAGIIKNDDVEAAMKLQLWHGGDPTQYLVELGCIDTRTHASAKQCLSLMERYSLSANDAALTLKYCYQRGISIEEALAELE